MNSKTSHCIRALTIILAATLCSQFLSRAGVAATWDGGKGSADAACGVKVDSNSAYKHSRAEIVNDIARCYVKPKEGKGDETYNSVVYQDDQPPASEDERNSKSPATSQQPAAPAPGNNQSQESCEAPPPPLAYAEMPDDEPVAAGKDFSTQQKSRVRAKNKEMNDGKLMSDDKDDPWYGKELVEPVQGKQQPGNYAAVPKNRAEVDHIKPKVAGGSNSYANARVISNEYNNKINAKGHKPKKKKC